MGAVSAAAAGEAFACRPALDCRASIFALSFLLFGSSATACE
jgi:hypothetical protein